MTSRRLFPSLAAPALAALLACGDGETQPEPSPQVTFMNVARAWHSMTVLPSSRQVLVAGGFVKTPGGSYVADASAELYDPASGTFTATGKMTTARFGHAAVLLGDGKVLIAGGESIDGGARSALSSAELYDPVSGTFAPTGDMQTPRAGPAARLPSGRVLAVGGVALADLRDASNVVSSAAEVYDPDTGTWTPTGALLTPRYFHFALTSLPSGEVLVVGGSTASFGIGATETAEIYSETTGLFRAAASLDYRVAAASAAPLPRGDVLLVGGCIDGNGYCSGDDVLVRRYDVAAGEWRPVAPLRWGRETAAALPLASGEVLVAGGTMYSNGSICTERFDPVSETWSEREPLEHDHGNGAAAVLLPGGDVLITGGDLILPMKNDPTSTDRATINVAERFTP